MAEVHLIGEITSATDFSTTNIFCKWSLKCGPNWKILSGKSEGQTCVSSSLFEKFCHFSCPVDIHLATTSIQGWPKIYIQVFHLDWLSRCQLLGYGLVTVPTTPGLHQLHCYTWRPLGSVQDRFVNYFLGGYRQLKYPDLIFSISDRFKLDTEAMGSVAFDLNVVMRNFGKFAVEYK